MPLTRTCARDLIFSLGLTLVLLLTACGGDKKPGQVGLPCDGACPQEQCVLGNCIDPGDPDAGPDADEPDTDDPNNDTPDADDKTCTADGDCQLDEFCNLSGMNDEGVCEAGCRLEEGSCDAGQLCDEETHACVDDPATCEGDEECAEGQTCQDGRCVGAACQDDAQCAAGEICDEGFCVEGCRQDTDCASSEYCDTDNNQCESGCRRGGCPEGEVCDLDTRLCAEVPCEDDDACGAGQICTDGACAEGCRDDGGCLGGEVCEDSACVVGCRDDAGCEEGEICSDGQCAAGCRQDDDCDQGEICADNQCVAGCRQDDDCAAEEYCNVDNDQCESGCRRGGCPEGEVCDPDTRQCAVLPCSDDASCDSGQICQDDVCVDGCREDAGCDQGEICEAGQCRNGCRADAACGDGAICQDAVCVDGCRDDAGCPGGQVCQDNACVDGPECRDNADCDNGQICSEGQCVAPECNNDGDCGQGEICVNNACVVGDCRDNADCNGDQQCRNNVCVDPGCQGDGDCGQGEICQDSACVAGCRQDNQCDQDEVCSDNVCVPATCADDTECPNGQICLDGACVAGCREDFNCGLTEICTDNVCVPGCRADSSCLEGQICQEGLCVAGCRGDLGCPEGNVCRDQQCVPGCRDDAECDAGEECIAGNCRPVVCARDTDCPPGNVCNDNNACVFGCRDDAECGQGRICGDVNRLCINGCRNDLGCAGDQFCDLDTLSCETGCRVGQCPPGEVCDLDTRVCGPEPCEEDVDCPIGEFCDQGTCEAGCRNDLDCGAGQVCDDQDRQCVAGCRFDEQCAPEAFCDIAQGQSAGTCEVGCRLRNCPQFQICDPDTRQCSGDVGMCFADDECGAGQICEPFFCVEGCRQDGDCAEGQICDPEANFCRAGCTDDAQCRQGDYCDSDEQRCVPGCRGDNECEVGLECREVPLDDQPGLTRQSCEPTLCQGDDDCPGAFYCTGEVCAGGCRLGSCPAGLTCAQDTRECEPSACANDGQCPGGFFCDPNQQRCAPGCRGDNECDLGELCDPDTNQCVPGCREDNDCGDVLYCDLPGDGEPGLCEAGCRLDGCAQGEVCDPQNRRCVPTQCQVDADCLEGEFCRDGVECEPGCRDDAQCAQGQICLDDARFCALGCRQDDDDDDVCADALGGALDLEINAPEVIGGQIICLGDQDHVAVALNQGERLNATLAAGIGDGVLEMELTGDDCGQVLATSRLLADVVLEFEAPRDGIYVVRVKGEAGRDTNAYSLTLTRQLPLCVTDRNEPNNDTDRATRIPPQRGAPFNDPGLTVCAGDEDWFAVTVEQAGDVIRATLTQSTQDVPLRIEVRFTNGTTILDSAQEVANTKTVETLALSTPGTYFVRVSPTEQIGDGPGVGYNLQVVVSEAGACIEDSFETNDDIERAALVTSGSYTAALCQDRSDSDWYRVVLLPGDTLDVSLTYDHELIAPDFELPSTIYGPGGEFDFRDVMTRQGQSNTDSLAFSPGGITVGGEDGGEWYIEVLTGGGGGALDYTLDVSVTTPDCGELDPEPTPNDSCATATRLAPGASATGFVCGPSGDEDWFIIADEAGQSLGALLEHFHFDGNLEMEAYEADGETLIDFSYNAGPNFESIVLERDRSGDVCVRVFVRDRQEQNRYTLSVDFN